MTISSPSTVPALPPMREMSSKSASPVKPSAADAAAVLEDPLFSMFVQHSPEKAVTAPRRSPSPMRVSSPEKKDATTPEVDEEPAKRKREEAEESTKPVVSSPNKASRTSPVKKTKVTPSSEPAAMSEGRSRRQVQQVKRLSVGEVLEEKALVVPNGTGVKFGDISFVEDQIAARTGMDETLRGLHRVVYPGATLNKRNVKGNLRQFCGFEAAEKEKQATLASDKLLKWTLSGLKELCEMFGLERSGTKEVVVERLAGFLMEPKDFGKKPTSEVKKERRLSLQKKKARKEKAAAKKKASTSKNASVSKKNKDDEEEEEEEGEAASEESGSEAESEQEEYKPAKKRGSPSKKETAPAVISEEMVAKEDEEWEVVEMSAEEKKAAETEKNAPPSPVAKSSPVKAAAAPSPAPPKELKSVPATPATVPSPVEAADEDEDDVPLSAKLTPPAAPSVPVPTDEELRARITQIVSTADLSVVTKKMVIVQLQEQFGKQVLQSVSEKQEDALQWWTSKREDIRSWIDDAVNALG